MAAVADDASSNATQVQPAFQVGSVVPMSSADDAGAKATQVQPALQAGPVVPTSSESENEQEHADKEVKVNSSAKSKEEFLDVMLRGRQRLQSSCDDCYGCDGSCYGCWYSRS